MINKILYAISIIGWLTVIYLFSSMPTESSNGKSKEFIRSVSISACVIAENIGIINTVPDKEIIENFVNTINYPIRKVAHATVYFILATILMFAIRGNYNISYIKSCIIVLIVCFLYSLTDEYHQTFINGRTGQFSDCVIDTLGGGLSVLIYSGFRQLNIILNKEKKSQIQKKMA